MVPLETGQSQARVGPPQPGQLYLQQALAGAIANHQGQGAFTQGQGQQHDDPPTLVIHGIYGKAEIPRKEELPVNYAYTDLAPDQIMVRKRLEGKQSFLPEVGLVSEESLLFYHNDLKLHQEEKEEEWELKPEE
jgi:hypothetical protein